MPEGDTIHHAARRVGAALVGQAIESIEMPHPRHRLDRWPQRLANRAVESVDAHGKHLFLRFEGGLTLHSHLRMGGKWGVYRRGERWRRATHRAWLVIRTAAHEVVQFDGPVLELMTESRTRFDRRLAALGPDILAPDLRDDHSGATPRWDERAFIARPAKRRRHPQHRRRAARPAHASRHRQHLEVRVVLHRGRRPVAPGRSGDGL